MAPSLYVCLAVLCGAIVPYAESALSVCELPMEIGSCAGDFSRYYYNAALGYCVDFLYGGCNGNSNNFNSKKECISTCLPQCYEPPKKGSCSSYTPSYTYNQTSGSCEPYAYGGCGATGSVFPDHDKCTKACVSPCDMEPEAGDCNGIYPSYFYNSTSKRCEPFTWTGCGGNGNRFPERRWCIRQCARHCYVYANRGPCREDIPRWWYNMGAGNCEEFTYGGCEGSDNSFETKNDCLDQCGNLCKQDPVKGPCNEKITRYFYNSTTLTCEIFTYGGCEGNSNNYESASECMFRCGWYSQGLSYKK